MIDRPTQRQTNGQSGPFPTSYMRVSSGTLSPPWDHIVKTVSKLLFQIAELVDNCYLLLYLILAQVLEIGVVEVHEGVLEGTDQHVTIQEKFLVQNCTCQMDEKLKLV